jgi:hypothetical protein
MNVQYISNKNGQVTAVQVPIKEWEMIKSKYPDIDNIDIQLPEWHKEIIDARLEILENNPDQINPISTLMDELDK